MTQSTGVTGRGITFEISDGESPDGWVAIANLASTGINGRTAEEIDFTHLASSGGFREYRQGFKDPGTIPLELHFTPTETTHVDLLDKFISGANFNWRINWSGAGIAMAEYGVGFVQNPGDLNINPNDPVGGAASVRVTGQTTWSSAA
ncbi:phage tail tube protein [Roseibium sp. Sym1]|uniref:phage tail tube protein n=1 Tax=Roseibium sp. Sym1 TaxID=3016006 RepID=UPI0022B53F55|nr:phage tail tube protein [Roseibium sp. Sym1]